MPITLEYYNNGVLYLAYDIVTDKDLEDAEFGIYDHNYPGTLQYQICDFTTVTDFQASIATMRRVGLWDRKMAEELNNQYVAVVAPEDSHVRTMVLIWEVWTRDESGNNSGVYSKIVNTRKEAVEWLTSCGLTLD